MSEVVMRSVDQAMKSIQEQFQPARGTMGIGHTEIRVKGRAIRVSTAEIDDRIVLTTGNWLKIAAVQDEEVIEGDTILKPESFISQLKGSGLNADVFTFAQKLPDTSPRYPYHLEWDNFAVIPITTFSEWWEKRAKYDVRSAVKKARRLGIVTKSTEFDDKFVEGIVNIYDEAPFRQGKRFWHYKKDFKTIKQLSSTYLERSIFIGAYYRDELVGFIKMVKVGSTACTFHVISMKKHFDKKPTNALIAKAVEICAEKRMSHLVYGNFVYRDPRNSLTEFKRRNGFQQTLIPRYYVPLTQKGKIALAMKLHHGISELLPQNVWRVLLNARAVMWKLRRSGSD